VLDALANTTLAPPAAGPAAVAGLCGHRSTWCARVAPTQADRRCSMLRPAPRWRRRQQGRPPWPASADTAVPGVGARAGVGRSPMIDELATTTLAVQDAKKPPRGRLSGNQRIKLVDRFVS